MGTWTQVAWTPAIFIGQSLLAPLDRPPRRRGRVDRAGPLVPRSGSPCQGATATRGGFGIGDSDGTLVTRSRGRRTTETGPPEGAAGAATSAPRARQSSLTIRRWRW